MKFSLSQSKQFGWAGLKGWALNSKDDFANASAAYFEITGRHGRVKTTLSDRIYFVIEGEGIFYVNDQEVAVGKDDMIIIPKDTPYDYKVDKGVLKLFLVHIPAYDEKYDVKLE